MAELGLARRGAVVDGAIDDQPAADAAAECDVKKRVGGKVGVVAFQQPRAAVRLAIRRGVGVVFHDDGSPHALLEPVAQGKVVPPLDLVRDADPAFFMVDRPAEPDRDALDTAAAAQLADSRPDLLENTGPALCPVHRRPPALVDASKRITLHDLQLGAADLDSQQSAAHSAQSTGSAAPRQNRGPAAWPLPETTGCGSGIVAAEAASPTSHLPPAASIRAFCENAAPRRRYRSCAL